MLAGKDTPRWNDMSLVLTEDFCGRIPVEHRSSSLDILQREAHNFLRYFLGHTHVRDTVVGTMLIGAYVLLEASDLPPVSEDNWRMVLSTVLLNAGSLSHDSSSQQCADVLHGVLRGAGHLSHRNIDKFQWPCADIMTIATSRLRSRVKAMRRSREFASCITESISSKTSCASEFSISDLSI